MILCFLHIDLFAQQKQRGRLFKNNGKIYSIFFQHQNAVKFSYNFIPSKVRPDTGAKIFLKTDRT